MSVALLVDQPYRKLSVGGHILVFLIWMGLYVGYTEWTIELWLCFSITFDRDADREQTPGAVLSFQTQGKGDSPERYLHEYLLEMVKEVGEAAAAG